MASNPQEAIGLAESFDAPIRLLLTDVVMPHMNGLRTRNSGCWPNSRDGSSLHVG